MPGRGIETDKSTSYNSSRRKSRRGWLSLERGAAFLTFQAFQLLMPNISL